MSVIREKDTYPSSWFRSPICERSSVGTRRVIADVSSYPRLNLATGAAPYRRVIKALKVVLSIEKSVPGISNFRSGVSECEAVDS